MADRPEIDQLRKSIDGLDRDLVELLARRAELAREIGDRKRASRQPFHDTPREESVVERLQGYNDGRFPERALEAVYHEIFGACLSLQEPLQLAFPGGRDGFVHEAAAARFGISCRHVPAASPDQALRRLAAGEVSFAILPFENSLTGLRTASLDALARLPLPIAEELMHRPLTRLYGFGEGPPPFIAGELEVLRTLADPLDQLFPGSRLQGCESLPEMAERILREKRGALLAGERLGREFELPVLQESLEPSARNIDRYLVLGGEEREPSGRDKTSLFAELPNHPGSLQGLLALFSRHGIDLLALDSRPRQGLPWEYRFFLELAGHRREEPLSTALAEAEALGTELAILGSYPRVKGGEGGLPEAGP